MKNILVLLALVMVTSPVGAANGVTPGQFVIEPATLICLGFEWDITGDDNRNATVEVRYRVSGQTAWIDGMPLNQLMHVSHSRIGPQRQSYSPSRKLARRSGRFDQPGHSAWQLWTSTPSHP